MLLKKNTFLSEGPHEKVVIIGRAPKAFLFAYLLQNNNFDVSFLVPPQNLPTHPSNESMFVKTDKFRTKRLSVSFTDNLSSAAKFCIIASTPKEYKTDFLLSQNTFLKEAVFFNFSHRYNHHLFKQIKDQKIIECYDTEWLKFEKNTLELLSNKVTFDFICSTKELSSYETMFKSPFIEVKNSSPTKLCFWKNFTLFFISQLLLTSYKKDMITLLNQKEIRKQVSGALNELSSLAKKDNETIKTEEILAFLYTIPKDYKGEFLKKEDISVLIELLPQISYFETPELFKLITLANKNLA